MTCWAPLCGMIFQRDAQGPVLDFRSATRLWRPPEAEVAIKGFSPGTLVNESVQDKRRKPIVPWDRLTPKNQRALGSVETHFERGLTRGLVCVCCA